MRIFISLLSIILLSSCAKPKKTTTILALEYQNDTAVKKIIDARIEAEIKATTSTDTYKKLQGLWMNAADTLNFMLIDQGKKRDFSESQFYSPEHYFTIDDKCLGTDSLTKPEDKERYLSIINETRQCYYIEQLTDSTLQLKNMSSELKTKYLKR